MRFHTVIYYDSFTIYILCTKTMCFIFYGVNHESHFHDYYYYNSYILPIFAIDSNIKMQWNLEVDRGFYFQ